MFIFIFSVFPNRDSGRTSRLVRSSFICLINLLQLDLNSCVGLGVSVIPKYLKLCSGYSTVGARLQTASLLQTYYIIRYWAIVMQTI